MVLRAQYASGPAGASVSRAGSSPAASFWPGLQRRWRGQGRVLGCVPREAGAGDEVGAAVAADGNLAGALPPYDAQ